MTTTSRDHSSVRGAFTTLSAIGQDTSPPDVTVSGSLPESILPLPPGEVSDDEQSLHCNSGIYMSVFSSTLDNNSRKLGLAYVNIETEILHIGEFVDTDGRFLQSMKLQLTPKTILTLARPDEELFQMLKMGSETNDAPSYDVTTTKRTEFNFQSGLHRLKSISIRELENDSKEGFEKALPGTFEFAQVMKIMSVVDFEKKNMVCAAGALLSYIQKNQIINQLEDKHEVITIAAIRQIVCTEMMVVDDLALRALCIVQSEAHPVGSSTRKEGLSIFKLLDETRTSQGRRMLRAWILSPTLNIDTITKRQNAIERLLQSENNIWLTEVVSLIRNVKDVVRLICRFQNVRANYMDWLLIVQTIQQFISLHALPRRYNIHFDILDSFDSQWDDEIVKLNDLITSVIDFSESKLSKRLEIKHGISPELDRMKHNYEQLGIFLTEVAEELVASSKNQFEHLEVLHLPQLGHLIAIPVIIGEDIESQKNITSFEFQFIAEDKLFFKNERTRELDIEIGDIRGVIFDIEASFVRELAECVLKCKPTLLALSLNVAEIDCLISLAQAASTYNLCRPQFVQDKCLLIENGCHLLQNQTLDCFIPNDTYLDTEKERPIMLVTGPNRSGKSVLLKQVGIIVYLAHCGMFVPAESVTLGLVDQIFCRIDLQETAASLLSTFATDCNQISRMLRHATPSSLLLLDEFGKGTSKSDGIALLASLIHYIGWRAIDEIPRAIVTTHCHELFSLELLPCNQDSPISYYKMDVVIKSSSNDVVEDIIQSNQVTFLYHLVPGVSTQSFGVDCAETSGFPESVIRRAREVSNAHLNQKPIHRMNEDPTNYNELYALFLNLDLTNVCAVNAFVARIMDWNSD